MTKIKIGSKIYSIHNYADAINGKLDKVTSNSTYPQAYIKDTNGKQTMFSINTNAIASTIVIRDGNGNANIATPTQASHIANKRYVDNTINGKQDTLVSGVNIKTINGESILGSGNISIGGIPSQTITNSYDIGGAGTLSSTAIFTRCGNVVNTRLIISFEWSGDAIGWSKVVTVDIPPEYRTLQAVSVEARTTGLKLGTNCLAQMQIPSGGGFELTGNVAVSTAGKLTVSCSNTSDQYSEIALIDIMYFGAVTEI